MEEVEKVGGALDQEAVFPRKSDAISHIIFTSGISPEITLIRTRKAYIVSFWYRKHRNP